MPRIAFFPDSFHEINGVAHTARHFIDFAERRNVPMLCVRAAGKSGTSRLDGKVEVLELERVPWAFPVEEDLSFDPLFFRHMRAVGRALRKFNPSIVHITGPSELGILGAFFAWRLGVPLVASWHTNVHEYAGKRFAAKLNAFPRQRDTLSRWVESLSLTASARFYRLARVTYAPNPALCDMLQHRTQRVCHVMQRGVDTSLFSPAKRKKEHQQPFTLGFVGRLSVEKNVMLLPNVYRSLSDKGISARWLIVGHGAEERNLRAQLGDSATFTGVLRGEELAHAYTAMDLFVFPSHTDTFGNVVLEALASGTPAVVTRDGGPAYIVQDTVTGRVCTDDTFAAAVAELASDPGRLDEMRIKARDYALTCSWDSVFERVLAAYPTA